MGSRAEPRVSRHKFLPVEEFQRLLGELVNLLLGWLLPAKGCAREFIQPNRLAEGLVDVGDEALEVLDI